MLKYTMFIGITLVGGWKLEKTNDMDINLSQLEVGLTNDDWSQIENAMAQTENEDEEDEWDVWSALP